MKYKIVFISIVLALVGLGAATYQVVRTDSTLHGNGLSGNPLGVNMSVIRAEISDSLTEVGGGGGGFFTPSTATGATEQDCDGHGFHISNSYDLILEGQKGYFEVNGGGITIASTDSTYSFDGIFPKMDNGTSSFVLTYDDVSGHWFSTSINSFGGGGSLPYYELVANYVTDDAGDGTGGHTLTVLGNTFPETTWTASNLTVQGRIDLTASNSTFDFVTNNNKIVLIQSGYRNLFDNRFETISASGSDDNTIILGVYNVYDNGATGQDIQPSTNDHPLTIIIRYYY